MDLDVACRLARNARLGDGCFWKHPQSRQWNIQFTGINKAWIEHKATMAGKRCTLVRKADAQGKGVFRNAKELWYVKVDVHPIFDQYRQCDVLELLAECDMLDFAFWYLDDGCVIERRDQHRKDGIMGYRYFMCLGDLFKGDFSKEAAFLDLMRDKFKSVCGTNVGSVQKNNSKASAMNRNWVMPVAVGRCLVAEASKIGIPGFENKLRRTW